MRTSAEALSRAVAAAPPWRGRCWSALKCFAGSALVAILVGFGLASAHAQADFPNRTVTLVVAQAAGGGMDAIARVLTNKMTAVLGQSVIVENKPGGSENIAISYVAKAGPDGYTVLLCSNTVAINPNLYKNLQYDAQRDLRPIGRVWGGSLIVVAQASEPYATVAEMVAYAKANPNKLSYGSPGVGSPQHMSMELLKRKTGAPIQHIPYRGAAPGLNDLLAGVIPLFVSSSTAAEPHIKSGRIRGLVTSGASRLPDLDQIPTLGEIFPGTAVEAWTGMFIPAGVPKSAEAKLSNALKTVLSDPEIIAYMKRAGVVPRWLPPDDFLVAIKQEEDRWAAIIRDAGIKVE